MDKSERSKILRSRRTSIGVIKNIHRVRSAITKNKFDRKLFDAIQGEDGGIDNLVGRSIMFGSLTATECSQLRREIVSKLDLAEQEACEALRATTTSYLKLLDDAINRKSEVESTNKTLTDLSFKNHKSVAAFADTVLDAGSMDCERCLSTLEHLESIAQSLEDIIPSLTHFLDEEEEKYTEEEHEHEGEIPETDETCDDDCDDESDDDSGDEEDEIEEEDDDDEDEDSDDDESESDESEVEPADITWIKAEHHFLKVAKPFISTESRDLAHLGFEAERAIDILKMRGVANMKYVNALKKLRDVIAADVCTTESLLRGSKKFYKCYDKILNLVESVEAYRQAVDQSCRGLVKASRAMLIEATKSSYL